MITPVYRLSTRQAAEYLGGVPENTLRYWRYAGVGPRSYRLGRRCYYDIADLDRWIDQSKSATQRGGVA